jgi:hypothetical protein
LVFALRAANQTPDGLSYALAVRSGLEMFHPHHLIYVPVARLIHLATGVDPITSCLLQNLFWTVVLALAAWRLAGLILPATAARLTAVAALLAARGVMIYAVRVETYLPALACLFLTTLVATERPVRSWLLVPAWTLAILYHQTNVLFALPLMVLLCDREAAGQKPAGCRGRAALILIRTAAVVVGAYVLAFRFEAPPGGFWAFVLTYASAPVEAWGNFGYFSIAGIAALATSQARVLLPVPDSVAVLGAVAMLGGLVFLVGWHLRRLRQGAPRKRLRRFGLVFLATYLPFFLWWMPTDVDFFLAPLLPLWLLVLLLVRDLPAGVPTRRLPVALVVLLAAGNLCFTLVPMHRDPGPGRRLALALDRASPREAVFVTGYAVQQEMLYFTGRTRVFEGEGLARAVRRDDPPWSRDNEPVVVDGLYLRALLDQPEPRSEDFLRWLVGFGAADRRCLTFTKLPAADGLLVSPPRRAAGTWSSLRREIRELFRP